jgi:hypothetical protein
MRNMAQLTIVCPGDFHEGGDGFMPPQSITLYGTDAVRALRDLLNWALEKQEAKP